MCATISSSAAVGKFRFESLREGSPCIRQVKKQRLVGGIADQLCQPQALGAIESILSRSHPPPHYQHTHIHHANALALVSFRDHTSSIALDRVAKMRARITSARHDAQRIAPRGETPARAPRRAKSGGPDMLR
jgi:hypothetical protein